jgi:folate-dependent phosphoribosylglycinamide formyltransferase PurN
MPTHGVVLLTSEGEVGRMAASHLAARCPSLAVIVEKPASRWRLLRRRIARLGLGQVGGQLAFMIFQRLQQQASRRRIAEIIAASKLDPRWPDGKEVVHLSSVNSPECLAHLRRLRPQVILVVGTRIISHHVLKAIDAHWINYHAGITPKYRGVHGGYWARAEGDQDNFGVTVHLIDEGIDTGSVLYQARLLPKAYDNYSTYPWLQLTAALPLLERAAHDGMAGTLRVQKVELPSRLWSHPTLWQYINTGWRSGVW